MSKQYYDNTQLNDYKTCPRYYYLRHVKGFKPQGTAMPLIFGLAWHAAMDIVWRAFDKKILPRGAASDAAIVELAMEAFNECWMKEGAKDPATLDLQDLEILGARTPMTAKEMLHNYIQQRRPLLEGMKLVAAERPFAVPIYQDREDIWYIGRRDKDIQYNGDGIVIEHKTTTEYKKDGGFKTQYLESWFPNSQCEGYLYAARLELEGVRYVWVDAALVHNKVHDAFKFIPISASFANLDNWLWEARDWINRIISEKERLEGQPKDRSVMGAFPKNTASCVGKYGPCAMLRICRQYENPAQLDEAPAGYVHEPWHPFEILKISELGLKED